MLTIIDNPKKLPDRILWFSGPVTQEEAEAWLEKHGFTQGYYYPVTRIVYGVVPEQTKKEG